MGKDILVLDDQPKEREAKLEELLGRLGKLRWLGNYSRESFRLGEIAISVLSSDIAKTPPDLIILDLCLLGDGDPQRGLQVWAKLKGSKRLEKIPVLIVSDRANDKGIPEKIRKAGFSDDAVFNWNKLYQDEAESTERFLKQAKSALLVSVVSE
jgi:CheY-like chemotaxis protein